MKAKLILSDGTTIYGRSVAYEQNVSGEVVFNTAMTGYVESLTDPSYSGQILTFTYPLIGNYGVPEDHAERNGLFSYFESEKIQVKGLLTSCLTGSFSHFNAKESITDWLHKNSVVAIEGIDTRMLTKKLREEGVMLGKIVFGDSDIPFFEDPNLSDEVAKVSCKEVITYGSGKYKVILVDCGVKQNIIRYLIKHNLTVIRVPFDYDYHHMAYHGLFISNGPGNPERCTKTIELLKKSLNHNIPILGICLGHQLLALSCGAKIIKLKYGHRGHNQPVKMVGSNKCFLTSQNHGYTVDSNTLPKDWLTSFINLNDGTNEGIRNRNMPFFAIQFHPEAAGGPTDTDFLFNDFFQMINRGASEG
jgi:carbamoyl-phosphate synthase small subunit